MTELKRTIGWQQLMLYGVGSMLGAGIYGLVGKAAGGDGRRGVGGVPRLDGRCDADRDLLCLDRLALSEGRAARPMFPIAPIASRGCPMSWG